VTTADAPGPGPSGDDPSAPVDSRQNGAVSSTIGDGDQADLSMGADRLEALAAEPGEEHVAAYATAADDLARRLDETGAGHDRDN
jgi:hypothetical protein